MGKELSLKEIQNEEFNILKTTIEFLNKHNFKYYIYGGTFLGAVRHQGFIPWDDDIDIAMPRPDFDKMMALLRNTSSKLSNNLEFTSFELNNSKYPFCKVINHDIIVEQKVRVDKNLWIDIFPLDGMPDDAAYRKKIIKKAFYKHQIISLKLMKYVDVFRSSKSFKTRIIKIILYPFLMFINIDKYCQKYINFCKQYDFENSHYFANLIWCGGKTDDFEKSVIHDCEFQFDNLTVNGFSEYDKVLTQAYGDYMKFPPENKRFTHNFKAFYKK